MHIGVAIDTSVKPSRDFLLALERIVIERDTKRNPLVLKFFLGSAATTAWLAVQSRSMAAISRLPVPRARPALVAAAAAAQKVRAVQAARSKSMAAL